MIAAIMVFGVAVSSPAQAVAVFIGPDDPVPADTPCDPDYYDSLESRAWLEAQREITQNQNLIFKPDSVLEYTCFDRFLDELAQHASDMLSESDRWGNILPANSMDKALNSLVGSALVKYLSTNFNHNLLGDRLGFDYEENEADIVISGGAYACNIMDQVWQTAKGTAKCRDFISNPETDGFFTFEEYRDGIDGDKKDKRYLPKECDSISDSWSEGIEFALVTGFTPWEEDDVVTYLDYMNPANCGKVGYKPIETGLTVYRNEKPQKYVERVCVMPGCIYVPPAAGLDAAGSCKK